MKTWWMPRRLQTTCRGVFKGLRSLMPCLSEWQQIEEKLSWQGTGWVSHQLHLKALQMTSWITLQKKLPVTFSTAQSALLTSFYSLNDQTCMERVDCRRQDLAGLIQSTAITWDSCHKLLAVWKFPQLFEAADPHSTVADCGRKDRVWNCHVPFVSPACDLETILSIYSLFTSAEKR